MASAPRRSVVILARVITAAVAWAGAEGVLALLGYPDWWRMDRSWTMGASAEHTCDPDLGWTARPGQFDLMWNGLRDHPVRTTNWARGRRATADHPPADGSGRPEVLFFGDSFIQGYGLDDRETLPWMVQARHPEVEVGNFGVGDYGTYQSYLAIKRWVHGPSSVFYELNGFHEDRNVAERKWLRIFRRPPSGCFFPFAEMSGGALRYRRSEGYLVWPLSRHSRVVAMMQEYKEIFETYVRVRGKAEVTEALLSKMNDTVQAEGGRFAVILLDLNPEERQRYTRFLQSHRIAMVNCDDLSPKDQGLRLPDGHPSAKMNDLLAQRIDPAQPGALSKNR